MAGSGRRSDRARRTIFGLTTADSGDRDRRPSGADSQRMEAIAGHAYVPEGPAESWRVLPMSIASTSARALGRRRRRHIRAPTEMRAKAGGDYPNGGHQGRLVIRSASLSVDQQSRVSRWSAGASCDHRRPTQGSTWRQGEIHSLIRAGEQAPRS